MANGDGAPDDGGLQIEKAPARHLAPERLARIRSIVEIHGAARVDELITALGVSPATVRRDLDELETEGSVRRVYGGVVAVDGRPLEPHFEAKAAEHADEKERIAVRAISMLAPDDTVYLDSGSTVLALARKLHGWNRLTVVTNSLPVVTELAGRGPHLVVVGGELRATSRAMVGPLSRFILEQVHVNVAFIGSYAVSLDEGLMTTDASEAFTKGIAVTRSARVVLLADSSKLGARSFAHAGSLDAIRVLVTDTGINVGLERDLAKRGITVIKA